MQNKLPKNKFIKAAIQIGIVIEEAKLSTEHKNLLIMASDVLVRQGIKYANENTAKSKQVPKGILG